MANGLLSLGFGIADRIDKKEQQEKDNAYRDKVFEYQKDIQQQIFDREDNAVQRRVADLEAAGMNKLLAGGEGAQASGLGMSTTAGGEAPTTNLGDMSITGQVLSAINTKNQLKNSEVDRELTQAKALEALSNVGRNDQWTEESKSNVKKNNQWIEESKSNQKYNNARAESEEWNKDVYSSYGLPTNFQVNSKFAAGQAAIFMAGNIANQAKKALKDRAKEDKAIDIIYGNESDKEKESKLKGIHEKYKGVVR